MAMIRARMARIVFGVEALGCTLSFPVCSASDAEVIEAKKAADV
jgi:adenine/guanine phosphoribosyltransferase-like PRPP-binding protein